MKIHSMSVEQLFVFLKIRILFAKKKLCHHPFKNKFDIESHYEASPHIAFEMLKGA